MIRILFGSSLVLACLCLSALAGNATSDRSKINTMRFELRSEAPPSQCGKTCRTWISAVGPVTERTPGDFAAFAGQHDIRGARLVLDSEGGSVVDTIDLGHAIRSLELTTTVGSTVVSSGPDGARATIVPSASCESMCAFVLLAGTNRYVPPEARVLVHEIWLAKKRERPENASYTADELVLVQHDIGSLARYTVEMGGSIELLEKALQVPPWEPLYRLTGDEIQRMGLNTTDRLFDEERAPAIAATVGTTLVSAPGGSVGRN